MSPISYQLHYFLCYRIIGPVSYFLHNICILPLLVVFLHWLTYYSKILVNFDSSAAWPLFPSFGFNRWLMMSNRVLLILLICLYAVLLSRHWLYVLCFFNPTTSDKNLCQPDLPYVWVPWLFLVLNLPYHFESRVVRYSPELKSKPLMDFLFDHLFQPNKHIYMSLLSNSGMTAHVF